MPTSTAGPSLRDIHVPIANWWPPAPGWWLLLGALLLVALVGAWWLRRRQRRRPLRRALAAELAALRRDFERTADGPRLAAGLSQLLRRVARWRGADVHISGAAWHAELQRLAPDILSAADVRLLERAPFQRGAALDAEHLLTRCGHWLRVAVEKGRA